MADLETGLRVFLKEARENKSNHMLNGLTKKNYREAVGYVKALADVEKSLDEIVKAIRGEQ